MSKHLDVWDRRQSNLFLNLSEVLPALNAHGRTSLWEADDFRDADGSCSLETAAEGYDPIRHAAELHAQFSFAELEAMALCVKQVIWASFKAFDSATDTPWLIMSAVDSTFWRFETNDISLRQSIIRRFKDVRMGQP